MEFVRALVDGEPKVIRHTERLVDRSSLRGGLLAAGDRKNYVIATRLDEQASRSYEPGEVVHLHIEQQSRDVVIGTVRNADDAVAERVEVRAHDGDFHALVYGAG